MKDHVIHLHTSSKELNSLFFKFSKKALFLSRSLIVYFVLQQDQYANSLMHDVNINFRVTLHRMVGSLCFFKKQFGKD